MSEETYYSKHQEEIKERSRRWTKDNPERKHQQNMKAITKKYQWVKDNHDKKVDANRKYNEANRDKVNAGNRRRRKEIKDGLYKILGGYFCSCQGTYCWHDGICGITNENVLQVGHKLDDGGKERKGGINRDKFYRFYLTQPELAKEKLEVTCANCNTFREADRKKTLLSG